MGVGEYWEMGLGTVASSAYQARAVNIEVTRTLELEYPMDESMKWSKRGGSGAVMVG